ncbi:MAG: DUF805 domain-containing protein [Azoarcus sp.]|jgi:uncharacterized membrane protein YhaH (DUF805 family)|nr:DUF805 domain-containing protein [Azoarcus sp.]
MKWFIKCLKHYADFNGRARREEYWMFTLFSIIFSFVWMFLAALGFAISNDSFEIIGLEPKLAIVQCYYGVLMFLPGLAVTVRRLHDIGRSGWLLLIMPVLVIAGGFLFAYLILKACYSWPLHNIFCSLLIVMLLPLIAGIWLLVLMLKDGQKGDNKYGPNPKTTPKTFDDSAKLKSAGSVFIAASVVTFLQCFWWSRTYFLITADFDVKLTDFELFSLLLDFVTAFILLTVGILLPKGKKAIMLLLVLFPIFFAFDVWRAWETWVSWVYGDDVEYYVTNLMNYETAMIRVAVHALFYLLVVLFAAFLLFASKNTNLIRSMAVSVITFSSLSILCQAYEDVMYSNIYFEYMSGVEYFKKIISISFSFLVPVACIILAATFLSLKNKLIFASSPVIENGNSSDV